jgi:hypothetical protein
MAKCLIMNRPASVAGCKCNACSQKRIHDTDYMRQRRKDPEFRAMEARNMQIYRQRHPEYRKRLGERSRKYHTELVNLLGGSQCRCPGGNCWHKGPCLVNDIRVAHIEHRRGGGVKEVREKMNNSMSKMYRYYLSHADIAKSRLRIYCSNCNWVKRYNNRHESGGAPRTRDWTNSVF